MQAQNQASALGDRFRGLDINNDSSNSMAPGSPEQAPVNTAQNVVPHGSETGTSQSAPKGPKKRPNQAQRRQMNSEWTIPVDVRQTSQPTYNQRQSNGPFYSPPRQSYHGPRQDTTQLSQHGRGGVQSSAASFHNNQHGFQSHRPGNSRGGHAGAHGHDWRQRQQFSDQRRQRGVNVMSPDNLGRGRPNHQNQQFHNNGNRQYFVKPEELANQTALLDFLCHHVNAGAEIEPAEIAEKENFRLHVQDICRAAIHRFESVENGRTEWDPTSVQLKCFGSLMSGFATKAADMDLGLLSPMSDIPPEDNESLIPRVIEKALLQAGFGARLLTRTRVPIIKLCEQPGEALYKALVDSRDKWDNGIVEDDHDIEDDGQDAHDAVQLQPAEALDSAKTETLSSTTDSKGNTAPKSDSPRTPSKTKTWVLKQSANQTLAHYYGQAKKLLRSLNVRDITHSNSHDFTPSEYQQLDEVSEAFVDGIYDEKLRARIHSFPSFRNSPESPVPNRRSLMGVFKMAEGESLVMLFENRAFSDGNWKKDAQSKAIVQSWLGLHDTPGIGNNPLAFNKELGHAVETLRSIPSIQLLQLSQEQHESAATYFSRTSRILRDLSGPEHVATDILSLALKNYIAGIHDDQIRAHVQSFATTTGIQSIETIALKHKILQLAQEYERALDKDLYATHDIPIVKSYVELLRTEPGSPDQAADTSQLVVVQLQSGSAALFERMRQLPDPSKLAPNQPKDKYNDKLEFPKTDIGVQCDINFSAHLALQNTLLLRCYSRTDPRVRPMVLFVKHWARVRGINTSYRGTLSSYGYVMMVLHYLINVVEPFVCPNLQLLAPPDPEGVPVSALEGLTTCKGYNIRFWRDEDTIQTLAVAGRINQSKDSLGALLRGFFEYYAQSNMMSTVHKRGFDWGRDVISLRTQGGLLTKQEKGWTGAKTVRQPQTGTHQDGSTPRQHHATPDAINQAETKDVAADPPAPDATLVAGEPSPTKTTTEFKEVRNRYLFAIEDPFEIEHNVARTVTHNGIVSIRDEFRRAWRIIKAAGRGPPGVASSGGGPPQPSEDLLEDINIKKEVEGRQAFATLLNEIHGLK